MRPRWIALTVAVSVLIAAIPVLARPLASPSALLPAPSGTPQPSSDGEIAFVDAGSPEEAAWYRIGGDPREFPPRLQIGTPAAGVTFEKAMADPRVAPNAIVPLRPVLGIGDGVVVLVEDDGRRSTLNAVVAATGDVHELLVSNDVVVNGLLDRDGGNAYFLTADRSSGDLTGAWRLAVGDGLNPEPIEALSGVGSSGIRLAAITRHFSRMLLSPDGSTLGVFRCIEMDCVLRAVRTDDGSLIGEAQIPRGGGDPFAITSTSALLRPIVQDGPFNIGEVIDLASGASAPMPFDGWPFGGSTLIQGGDGPAMVVQSAGSRVLAEAGPPAEPPMVDIINAADLVVTAEFAPPLASLAIVDVDDPSVGVDLPPGWFLMWGTPLGDNTTSAYAMSVVDGSLVPLPWIGGHFVQG